MRFVLVDRIRELEPGKRIVATKALSLAEEYLADHFPSFPVLPGVLMLESMVQASAWLLRASLDFRPTLVVLKEARNATYKSFVTPGQVLTLESVCKELGPQESIFAAAGQIDGRETVRARLTLRHVTLADSDESLSEVDRKIRTQMRSLFGVLWSGRPQVSAPA